MNKIALQTYISTITENSYKELNIDPVTNKINGTIIVSSSEEIYFETQFEKEDDNNLTFNITYYIDKHNPSNTIEETHTFIIDDSITTSFFGRKTKYLIHLINGELKQAYIVNKKYQLENGISESYTKMNMKNKEAISNIPINYQVQNNSKSKR